MLQEQSTIGVRAARSVAIAGIAVALSGLLVQAVATRPLSEADLAQFLAFWSMTFGVIGIVQGVQHEATRSTAEQHRRHISGGARIVPVALGIGLAAALLVIATSPLWSPSIAPAHTAVAVGLIAFAAVALSGHAAVIGVLAGRQEWHVYSRLMAAESLVRLVLVLVIVAVGAPLVGYEIATAIATATWLVSLPASAALRRAVRQRGDVAARQFLRRTGHALLASTSTAVLVVGYPALIGITSTREEFIGAAALILGLSLTRAPLLLPINAFQGVAIQHFVASTERRSALGRLILLVLAVGVVGSGLAYGIGPWLLEVITGRALPGVTLAALTLASTLLAILTLTGTVAIAAGQHRSYSAGWAVAAGVSVALLFLPLPVESRVLVSLALGPVAGSVVHMRALRKMGSYPRASGPSAHDRSKDDDAADDCRGGAV